MNPSAEQAAIIEAVLAGKNVKVEAVAGAGKTTLAEFLSKIWMEREGILLVLCYNRSPMESTRARLAYPAQAETIHSLMCKAYGIECSSDIGLSEILRTDAPLSARVALNYSLVFLDECQDIEELRFRCICKFLSDLKAAQGYAPQLVIVGDANQTVYEFLGCDRRYLTLADRAFGSLNDREWATHLCLKICYRIPLSVTRFLNEAINHKQDFPLLIPSPKAIEQKDDPILNGVPVYYRGDTWKNVHKAFQHVNMMITMNHWRPEDVFVLAPSVDRVASISSDDDGEPLDEYIFKKGKKGRPPVMYFAELLTNAGHPIFVRNGRGREKDAVERGKIVFSSFPGVKGCGRKAVFVFDFSQRYFACFDIGGDPLQLPVSVWVACTRASEKLYLFAESTPEEHFKFLSLGAIHKLAASRALQIEDSSSKNKSTHVKPAKKKSSSRIFTVTDLTGKIYNGRALQAIVTRLKTAGQLKQLPLAPLPEISFGDGTVVSNDELVESVSDINGTLITFLLEILGCSNKPSSEKPFVVAQIEAFLRMGGVNFEADASIDEIETDASIDGSQGQSEVGSLTEATDSEDELDRSDKSHLECGRKLLKRYASVRLPHSPDDISPELISLCLELSTYFRTTPGYPGTPFRHLYTQLNRCKFRWLNVVSVRRVIQRLVDNYPFAMNTDSSFEYNLGRQAFQHQGVDVKVDGLADLHSSEHLVEIKTKKDFETVDFLQLCCYKFLDESRVDERQSRSDGRPRRRYTIYNVLKNEQWELTTPLTQLREIVKSLVALRLAGPNAPPDDDTFIAQCRAIAVHPTNELIAPPIVVAPLISAPASPMALAMDDGVRSSPPHPTTLTRSAAAAACALVAVGGTADRESATQEAPFSSVSPSPKRPRSTSTP